MTNFVKVTRLLKFISLSIFCIIALWIIGEIYNNKIIVEIVGIPNSWINSLILTFLVGLIFLIISSKPLLEKIKVASSTLLFIQAFINILLTIWLITWLLNIYNGIMQQANNFGEIVKTSWMTVKRCFTIEEKLLWVAEIKENIHTKFSWETLNLEEIHCKNDLIQLIKVKLITEKSLIGLYQERITEELLKITNSPLKLFIYDHRYFILSIIGASVAFMFRNEILDNFLSMFRWLKSDHTIGDLLSQGYDASYNTALAGIKSTKVSTYLVNTTEKLKEISINLAVETMSSIKKQEIYTPVVKNIISEMINIKGENSVQQKQIDLLTLGFSEIIDYLTLLS